MVPSARENIKLKKLLIS